MRYHVGDAVYARTYRNLGPLRIASIEYVWKGCVEVPSFCKLRTEVGIIRVPIKDVLTPGEAVAETLAKGTINGHDMGVR